MDLFLAGPISLAAIGPSMELGLVTYMKICSLKLKQRRERGNLFKRIFGSLHVHPLLKCMALSSEFPSGKMKYCGLTVIK